MFVSVVGQRKSARGFHQFDLTRAYSELINRIGQNKEKPNKDVSGGVLCVV